MGWVVLLGLAASRCVDFGYDVPRTVAPASSASASSASTGDCVEGPAEPATGGPQVRFATLNVDVAQLHVTSGDVVTWTNTDSMVHSIINGAPGSAIDEAQGGFKSPELPQNSKWAYRFCKKRTTFYFCGKHPQQMNGYRIVVE